MEKILSITAAQPGWFASFDNGDGTTLVVDVAVWAIVGNGYEQRITGYSPSSAEFFLVLMTQPTTL